ncbi:MAG: DUF883 family protein [Minwuia sp.]|uniref:DUF883 family protein n=1 Tax=Minwuia sp. TaxID=2493630 RepID=UPI003A859C53
MAAQTSTGNGSKRSNEAEVTTEDLREDFDRLRADMSKLVEQMAELSRNRAADARDRTTDKAQEYADRARGQADRVARRAEDNYHAGRDWISDQVSERPVATIGIAVLAGVLIGRALKR